MTAREETGRKKFIEALQLSERSYCEKFPAEEGELRYTAAYLRTMKRLLKKSRRTFFRSLSRTGKIVAAAAISIAILGGSLLTVSAVRGSVIEFINVTYEKFMEFFFDDASLSKAPETIEAEYTLGYLPEGYELTETQRFHLRITRIWKNSEGYRIRFSQRTFCDTTTLDCEDSSHISVYVDNIKVSYIEKSEIRIFYWNSPQYAFSMDVPSQISMEDCLFMIASVISANDNIE